MSPNDVFRVTVTVPRTTSGSTASNASSISSQYIDGVRQSRSFSSNGSRANALYNCNARMVLHGVYRDLLRSEYVPSHDQINPLGKLCQVQRFL